MSRAFWTEHGIRSEPQDLDNWDEEKVQRWLIVMDVVAKYEAAQARINQERARREARGS